MLMDEKNTTNRTRDNLLFAILLAAVGTMWEVGKVVNFRDSFHLAFRALGRPDAANTIYETRK